MLDPLLALGVASNIVQFVDFSSKLISGAIDIYGSLEGATKFHLDLETVTADLSNMSTKLSEDTKALARSTSGMTMLSGTMKRSDHPDALGKLARQCKQLADELIHMLQQLKVSGKFKALKSGIATIKAALRSEDIARCRSALESIRSEMMLRMVAIISEQQREMFQHLREQLDDETHSHRTIKLNTESLERSMDSIVAQFSSAKSDMEPLLVDLKDLAQNWKDSTSIIRILNSLSFESINARWEAVNEAYSKTFEWAFEAGKGLMEWLSNGSQMYWITGKPGSGKSAFMKFLFCERRTRELLRTWSGELELIIASHFFWISGTPMQRSLAGLLRSLLTDLLQVCPKLAQVVIAEHRLKDTIGSKVPWTISELRECFHRLKNQTTVPLRVCFFVDGLDEYDGDHEQVLEMFNDLTKNKNIKACLSSRDWNVFLDWFQGCESLRVENLTVADIKHFTESKLKEDRRFAVLRQKNESYDSIIELIVSEAGGVFLWVHLVVESLKRGFIEGDTIRDLTRRIKQLPKKLEDFFLLILNSVEEIYHQESAEILKIFQAHSDGQLNLIALSFFDSEDYLFGTNCDNKHRWKAEELYQQYQVAERRIRARCRDLITIRKPKGYEWYVEFVHRSAKDFVQSGTVSKMVKQRVRADFNAFRYLCQASIAQAKLMPRRERKIGLINEFDEYAADALRYVEKYAKSCDGIENSMLWLDELNDTLENEGFCSPERLMRRETLIRRSWLFYKAVRYSGTMYLGHCISPIKSDPLWTNDLGPRLVSDLIQGSFLRNSLTPESLAPSYSLSSLQSAFYILIKGSICGDTRVSLMAEMLRSNIENSVDNLPLCLLFFKILCENTGWTKSAPFYQLLCQFVDEMLRRTNLQLLHDYEVKLLVDRCHLLYSGRLVVSPGLSSFLQAHSELVAVLKEDIEQRGRHVAR